jgi:MFS family permease
MPWPARLPAEHPVTKATLLTTSCFISATGANVSPILRDLETVFGAVPNADVWVRLVLTLPALLIVVGSPIAGWIVDRYGRKVLLVVSTVLYGFAGGSGFIAPTLGAILVGRAVLGLAAAGLMTSVTTLITDYYTGARRTQFLGIQAACMGLAGAVFLTLGGILAEHGWRWPFLVYLSAFLVVPFIATVLHEPARERDNPPAARESGAGLAGLDGSAKWPVGFMFFVYGTLLLLQIAYYLIPVEFSFFLNDLVGASGRHAGLAVAFVTFSFAGGSLCVRPLRDRFTNLQLLAAAFPLVAIGFLSIGLASGWLLVIIGLPFVGFGLGLAVPNLNVWLADSVPDAIRGRALGLFTTALFLGQFLSPIIARPVTRAGSVGTTFIVTGAILGIISVAGFIALQLHRTRWTAGRTPREESE